MSRLKALTTSMCVRFKCAYQKHLQGLDPQHLEIVEGVLGGNLRSGSYKFGIPRTQEGVLQGGRLILSSALKEKELLIMLRSLQET